MTNTADIKESDRVRIEEEEEPFDHVGQMAIVESVTVSADGESVCVLKLDRDPAPLTIPTRFVKKVETRASSILANDLFLPWDLNDPQPRMRAFLDSEWIAGRLLEGLLYYDHMIVPTVDFAVVVPLVHWLGVPLFNEILTADAVRFVRYQGGLSYVGNGAGLNLFEIWPPANKEEPFWTRAARSSPEEAVDLQLRHRLEGLPKRTSELLPRLVALCTVDTGLPEFVSKVEEETYRDVLWSPVLASLYEPRANLKRLPGVDANQFRCFARLGSPAVAGDPIDITLRLAMLNLETYLAEEAGARDMVTDRGFGQLLNAKAERFSGGKGAAESFSRLRTIERIPDVLSAAASREIDRQKLWQFRNTRRAAEFRRWFDEVGPNEPDKLVAEYGDCLKAGGFLSTSEAKILRIIVVQAAGIALAPYVGPLAPLAAMALSAADCFLLDKIRLGFNPRYFLDDLSHEFFESGVMK